MNNLTYNFNDSNIIDNVDCGVMQQNFSDNFTFNAKLVSIVMFFLIIFEWWAINRVMDSNMSHDRKSLFVSYIYTFIHSLILFGSFYLMYIVVLSGLDF